MVHCPIVIRNGSDNHRVAVDGDGRSESVAPRAIAGDQLRFLGPGRTGTNEDVRGSIGKSPNLAATSTDGDRVRVDRY